MRGYVEGRLAFETTSALMVWEGPAYPQYYIPAKDVLGELRANGETQHSPSRGDAEVVNLHLDTIVRESAGRRYPVSPIEDIVDHVRFEWDAIDEWLEEDEPIYTHPRDPYTRVDILQSSRHVRVVVDGVTVADSHSPHILFETGLPSRYYLPMSDVRLDLLTPTHSSTHCPYKGTASYWSLNVNGKTYDDLVWTYRTPLPESQKIAGLVCFYNEKVELWVDGELEDRPRTKLS
ncbi:MAG TPA: DUF427 domain-containing protein [Mycobacteriales bacterium]|nr:DUF427 domain-containing protein [Mycobacteriales bacterium]